MTKFINGHMQCPEAAINFVTIYHYLISIYITYIPTELQTLFQANGFCHLITCKF